MINVYYATANFYTHTKKNCYLNNYLLSGGLCTFNREFKQIATAGATTAAVTEKVWGEYVSVVCQILAKQVTKLSET